MQLKNKILIAYYSMTSHTRRVAELIQNAVGGELASIRTKETYSSDYEAMVEQGRREVNEGFLPVLNEFPVDIDACHMIFLGTPVWWYSIAPAMKSFLKNHDLRGKIIYPFVTNEGWAGHALQDFATNLSGGCIKSGMNVKFSGDILITKEVQIRNWAKEAVKDIF